MHLNPLHRREMISDGRKALQKGMAGARDGEYNSSYINM